MQIDTDTLPELMQVQANGCDARVTMTDTDDSFRLEVSNEADGALDVTITWKGIMFPRGRQYIWTDRQWIAYIADYWEYVRNEWDS